MEKAVDMQADNMKYSVLMSVYAGDKAEYIDQAINSMLNQTVPPEQFVVVKDGTVKAEISKLLDKYIQCCGAVFTIVSLEKNGGLANALNIGMQKCRNNLVARMDADDISLPERCEKELELFRVHPDLVVCGCNISEFIDDSTELRTSRIVPSTYEGIVKFSRRRQAFNHPTVMFKKDFVEEMGGYSRLRRKEDFDLFSRIISSGKLVLNIDERLYLYRVGEENYRRRKSCQNFSSAVNVYIKHWKRGGCSFIDFLLIVSAELFFMLAPIKIMKYFSDRFLRVNTEN